MSDFATRVTESARKFGPLCLGIDPHPNKVPALFGSDTAEGAGKWSEALVDLAQGRVAAVKFQVGLFERFGAPGMAALAKASARARAHGLITIMDAKRGDIGTTAEGYARAYLAPGAPFACDALTVNPYMGLDTLEPYVQLALQQGKGVIVLVRTSNPGARDFQTKEIGGAPLYMRVADALNVLVERMRSPCGWSNLMMVVGATSPAEARAVRLASPYALFLVPGYGAQGASASDAMAGLVRGEGGLINASRAVTFPQAAEHARSISEWASAIGAALNAAQDELRAALPA